MKIGVTLRNMGPQSSKRIMQSGAKAAEARALDSIWITDHIAIPPDDAEGSGGDTQTRSPLLPGWLHKHQTFILALAC